MISVESQVLQRHLPFFENKSILFVGSLNDTFPAQLKNSQIAEELALPPVKIHCSILAEDAIKAAVADYKEKHPA